MYIILLFKIVIGSYINDAQVQLFFVIFISSLSRPTLQDPLKLQMEDSQNLNSLPHLPWGMKNLETYNKDNAREHDFK